MRYSNLAAANEDYGIFHKFLTARGYTSDSATTLCDAAFDGDCFDEMCETQQREVDSLHLACFGRDLDGNYDE